MTRAISVVIIVFAYLFCSEKFSTIQLVCVAPSATNGAISEYSRSGPEALRRLFGNHLFMVFDTAGNRPAIAGKAATGEGDDEGRVGSGLVPGQFGGFSQLMRIGRDGSISYSDAKNLCGMKLLADDRLQIGFHNDHEISTNVTLPLVTAPVGQRRAVWSAELDGYVYEAKAIPFATSGCLFRLEKRREGRLVHGSQQFFAVKSRQAGTVQEKPAVAIDHGEWRVDQSGTGVVAGRYTGGSQIMQIADDGTVSYSDRPLSICHLAVLEDNRLTATFRDARGMPADVTLPLVTTAAGPRASWSAEVDGHTLRATAVPYSDTVYVFVLEKRRGGALIQGEQQFYAIDQKLRLATTQEKGVDRS